MKTNFSNYSEYEILALLTQRLLRHPLDIGHSDKEEFSNALKERVFSKEAPNLIATYSAAVDTYFKRDIKTPLRIIDFSDFNLAHNGFLRLDVIAPTQERFPLHIDTNRVLSYVTFGPHIAYKEHAFNHEEKLQKVAMLNTDHIGIQKKYFSY